MDNRLKMKYRFDRMQFLNAFRIWPRPFANQSERASRLGMSTATVSRIESGDRVPTIEELTNFCNAAGYSPADFFARGQEVGK